MNAAPSAWDAAGADGAGGCLEEAGEADGMGRVQRDATPHAWHRTRPDLSTADIPTL
ncbi:hypothetical protein [Streptomyces sp. NPDC056683]|uniref:hypothetical protein n=1 Tax=Streptomyces sp. NPDC056683 TaxID=3345910 RepID=UPI0036BB46E2